jgi:hypothetical protein
MIQVLGLTVSGIVLLWFGYSVFFGPSSPFYPGGFWGRRRQYKGQPGDPMVCPICSIKMFKGDLVKTTAYPSLSGGRDRLMYIRGCVSCLEHKLPRRCPVCGASMSVEDYLVSRMFERPNSRNHVHVIGCNQCRRVVG